MFNHPGPNQPTIDPLTGKLVLPAPPEQAYPPTHAAWPDPATSPPYASLPPKATQYAYPYSPYSSSPMAARQSRAARRKNHAHKVLTLAIALMTIALLVFITLGTLALLNSNGLAFGQNAVLPTSTHSSSLAGTPIPGQGNNQGDQQPSMPTPNPNTQPTPVPTDQGQNTLNVQIVQIPTTVTNGSRVHVQVQSNEPGVQVQLEVNYNAAPFSASSTPRLTDANGQATLTWNARVFTFRSGTVQATVRAIATDQNGQQVSSASALVLIET